MEDSRPRAEGSLRRAWSSLRTAQWWHFLPLPLASVLPGARAHPDQALLRGALATATVAACLGYAYGLNAITDRGGDRDARKNPLVGLALVPASVLVVVLGAGVLALALGASLGAASVGWTLISLLAGTLYSAGPRLKALPLVNTFTNALIFLPLLAVGQPRGGAATTAMPMLMLAFGALLTQNQLLHESADHDEDAASDAHTTAVLLGVPRTLSLAAALALGCAALLFALEGAGVPGRLAALLVALPAPAIALCTERGAGRGRRFHRAYSLVAGACIFAAVLHRGGLG